MATNTFNTTALAQALPPATPMADAFFATPYLVDRVLLNVIRAEISENGRELSTLRGILAWKLVCREFRAIMRGYRLVSRFSYEN